MRYLIVVSYLLLWTLFGTSSSGTSRTKGEELSSAPWSSLQDDKAGKDIKFRPTLSGRRLGKGKRYISFTEYQAADGVWLDVSAERFDSSQAAAKSFQARAAKSARVVERGFVFDDKGRRSGERVVINVPGGSAKTRIMIIINNEPVVYVIESPSLKHALAFEKQRRWVEEE